MARRARCSRTSSIRGSHRRRPRWCRLTGPRSAITAADPGRAAGRRPASRPRSNLPRRAPLRPPRSADPLARWRLANQDIQELVNGGLDASLRLTIPLTFVILLIAFGAVVAAFVPLVLAVTALLAAFGVLGLYSQLVDAGQPVREPAHRADRAGGRRRLLAVHDHPLPDRAAPRPGQARGDPRRVGDGRPSGVLLRARRHVLDRRPVPARRQPVPVDGHRDHRGRADRRDRLADVPAGDAGDPRRRRQPAAAARSSAATGPRAAACGRVVVRAVMRRPVIAFRRGRRACCSRWRPRDCACTSASPTSTSFPDSIDAVAGINLLNEKWPQGSTLALQVVVTKADRAGDQGRDRRRPADASSRSRG